MELALTRRPALPSDQPAAPADETARLKVNSASDRKPPALRRRIVEVIEHLKPYPTAD